MNKDFYEVMDTIICAGCENRGCGWCQFEDVVNCGLSKFDLHDQCVTLYDGYAVLESYYESNEKLQAVKLDAFH